MHPFPGDEDFIRDYYHRAAKNILEKKKAAKLFLHTYILFSRLSLLFFFFFKTLEEVYWPRKRLMQSEFWVLCIALVVSSLRGWHHLSRVSHFSQAPVGTHSVIKELSVGKVSSFVQKEVEASAFDLQWQHGRDFTSMGHAGNLGQGNCETGPQAKGGVSGQCHPLPSCKEHD